MLIHRGQDILSFIYIYTEGLIFNSFAELFAELFVVRKDVSNRRRSDYGFG